MAVLLLGGVAAGCSSGAASLTDGLVTNSTSASTPIRPKVPVGSGGVQMAAQNNQQFSAPSSAAAPMASRSVPASQSAVSSSPLPPPGSAQEQQTARAPSPSDMSNTPSASARRSEPQRQPSAQAEAPKAQAQEPVSTSSQGGSYTVASGDTLYGIARKTGADVNQIKQANGLSGEVIQVGQKLTIPGGSTVASATPTEAKKPANNSEGDKKTVADTTPEEKSEVRKVAAYTPPSDSSEPAEQDTAKAQQEDAEEDQEVASLAPESTGVGHLRWPVRGRVVSSFGSGGNSDGVNIAVPEGTAVHAAENGVVIYAGDGLKGFGNTVLVRHEDGLVTVYGHASDLKVKRGDQVQRGQEIARSGMSGDADRPQLHFEVRKGTNPVDPMAYLQ